MSLIFLTFIVLGELHAALIEWETILGLVCHHDFLCRMDWLQWLLLLMVGHCRGGKSCRIVIRCGPWNVVIWVSETCLNLGWPQIWLLHWLKLLHRWLGRCKEKLVVLLGLLNGLPEHHQSAWVCTFEEVGLRFWAFSGVRVLRLIDSCPLGWVRAKCHGSVLLRQHHIGKTIFVPSSLLHLCIETCMLLLVIFCRRFVNWVQSGVFKSHISRAETLLLWTLIRFTVIICLEMFALASWSLVNVFLRVEWL